jgi:isoquinoline 1-oxidoreductase subunit beta
MYFHRIKDLSALTSDPAAASLTRRTFLQFTTMAGAGFTLGAFLSASEAGAAAVKAAGPAAAASLASPFVRISPDNTVTLICKHVEAGQGVWTGLSAVLAEELDASWSQMRAEGAPAKVPTYGNVAFDPKGNVQGTGGSTSMASSWQQLREAGATARAMLVAAAAQRWSVPASDITVSEGIVSHASGKHATFGEIASDAAKQPVPKDVKFKDPTQYKFIGRDKLPRLDSRAKSTGTQQFAIDVSLPGMMTAVVLRPPRFGGKVRSIDSAAAKAVPGVVDVVQIPRGVAVVAHDTWAAKKGREVLQVAWDESGAESRGTDQLMAEYKRLAKSGEGALPAVKHGDAAAALKGAKKVVDAEFEMPYLAHAPMEPLTAVCSLSADRCEIWAGCQFQTIDQLNAAAACGLKPEQVFINTIAAGGTFGRRANIESDYISEVASIAKATGGKYPVRLIWTREDDLAGGRYRPLNYHHVTAGLGADGKVVGYQQQVVGQSLVAGTPFAAMMKDGVDPTAVEGSAPEQYEIANAQVMWTNPKVGVPVLWWRSVGHSHMAFSKEVVVDELAEAAGKDPIAFRLSMLEKNPRVAGVLKLAAEKAGWDKPFDKSKGRGRGVAVQESFGSAVAQIAEVTVKGDEVVVDRVVCVVDCGIAVTPDVVRAQMESAIGYGLGAALHSTITMTDGHVDQTNFHQYQVLRINEMPKVVEVHIVPSKEAPTGVGEPGTPPIAPAVANAIRMASGIKLRKLPFDLAAARAAKV